MKKTGLVLLLVLTIAIIAIIYIQEEEIKFDFTKVTEVSFNDISSMEKIEQLDGKKVKILGYMSPVSPYGYSYIYLTSTPYSTDVFNEDEYTSIAAYTDGKAISYSNHPVYVTGKLVVENITDTQEQSYGYRIVEAQIENATVDQVSDVVKKYIVLANDNILSDLNALFGQVDMLVYFDEYKELEYINEEKLTQIDISKMDSLIQKINNYNESTYDTIVNVLEQLKVLSTDLNKLLEEKKYSEFVNKKEKFEELYYEFYYYIAQFKV